MIFLQIRLGAIDTKKGSFRPFGCVDRHKPPPWRLIDSSLPFYLIGTFHPDSLDFVKSPPAWIAPFAWHHHDFWEPMCVCKPLENALCANYTFEWTPACDRSKWSKCTIFWKIQLFPPFPTPIRDGWVRAQTGPHGTPFGPLSCLYQHLTEISTTGAPWGHVQLLKLACHYRSISKSLIPS